MWKCTMRPLKPSGLLEVIGKYQIDHRAELHRADIASGDKVGIGSIDRAQESALISVDVYVVLVLASCRVAVIDQGAVASRQMRAHTGHDGAGAGANDRTAVARERA